MPEKAYQNKTYQADQWAGIHSEQRVIAHLKKHAWELQFQRARTTIAEVDLIFQKNSHVKLIEVKTLDDPWRSFERISHRQVQKLILNQLYISRNQKKFEISACVAWVSKEGIEYLEVN